MPLPSDAALATQRLDQWLVNARFVKTRRLAAALVMDGCVRINRQVTEKPHARVRLGDFLTIAQAHGPHASVRVIEVRGIIAKRGPASLAQTLYIDYVE